MRLQQVGKAFYESVGLRNGKPRKRKIAVYQCECGNYVLVRCDAIKDTFSCGCATSKLMSEKAKNRGPNRKTHGKYHDTVYKRWAAMKRRCTNQNDTAYSNYGGRGIKVCDAWMEFEAFYNDMGDPPEGGTLDRIDNNGDYEPGNCRWATTTEQSRNRRSNVLLTVDGETKLLIEWSEISGTSCGVIRKRMKNGWNDKESVFGRIT